MKRRVSILAFCTLLGAAFGVGIPARATTALTCSGLVQGGTYTSLTVPENGFCVLDGVTILGSGVANRHSELFVCNSSFRGSLTGVQAYVNLNRGTTLAGSLSISPALQISGTLQTSCAPKGPGSYSGIVCAARIGGALSVHDVPEGASEFAIGENCGVRPSIGSSVSIFHNRAQVEILNSDIGGSLSCSDNIPAAEQGNNTVRGTITGCVPAA